MCTQTQLQNILRQIHQAAVAEFDVLLDAVILYGSYARGDYDEESDIDIMIRVRMPKERLIQYRRRFSHLASDLGLEHDILVSIHLQDYDTFDLYKHHLPFYRIVDAEGVLVSA